MSYSTLGQGNIGQAVGSLVHGSGRGNGLLEVSPWQGGLATGKMTPNRHRVDAAVALQNRDAVSLA